MKKKPAKKAAKRPARKRVPAIPAPVEILGEPGADLTEKQREFCYLYAASPNATEAYQRAFGTPTRNAARVEAQKLLKNPAVAEVVTLLRSELLQKYQVTNERIIEEYARIAFVDLADLYGEDGNLLPIHDIPEHARRAVAAIECDEIEEWDDARDEDESGEPKGRRHRKKVHIGYTRKVKLWGKRDALQDLAKIRKMLTERVEHDVSENLADLLAEARQRAKSR